MLSWLTRVLIPGCLKVLLPAEWQYLILDIAFAAITHFSSENTLSYAISEKHAAVLQTALVESLVGCHPGKHIVFM